MGCDIHCEEEMTQYKKTGETLPIGIPEFRKTTIQVNLPEGPLPDTTEEMRNYAQKFHDMASKELNSEARNLLSTSGWYWQHRADLEDGHECGDRTPTISKHET